MKEVKLLMITWLIILFVAEIVLILGDFGTSYDKLLEVLFFVVSVKAGYELGKMMK